MIDVACFLAKETGWSMEYILDMPMSRVNIIASNLMYEKQVEIWHENVRTASIVDAIAKSNGGKYDGFDKLKHPPKREDFDIYYKAIAARKQKEKREKYLQDLRERGFVDG